MSAIIRFPRKGDFPKPEPAKQGVLIAVSNILGRLKHRKLLYYSFMRVAHANPVASWWVSDPEGVRRVRWSYDGRFVAVVGAVPGGEIQWKVDLGATAKRGNAKTVEEAMVDADHCLEGEGWVLV